MQKQIPFELAAKFQLVLLLDLGCEMCRSTFGELLQVVHAETWACAPFSAVGTEFC